MPFQYGVALFEFFGLDRGGVNYCIDATPFLCDTSDMLSYPCLAGWAVFQMLTVKLELLIRQQLRKRSRETFRELIQGTGSAPVQRSSRTRKARPEPVTTRFHVKRKLKRTIKEARSLSMSNVNRSLLHNRSLFHICPGDKHVYSTTRTTCKMAGLIVGILHILQKVLCGGGNVDNKPNHSNNDYYNNQQQQPNQGFPPLQANNYPPQQGIGRPPQNAWNGQHNNGQHNNGYQNQQSHGQQHNNNNHNGPYQASNQANLQRPNYQGPGGLVGGAISGPYQKQVSFDVPCIPKICSLQHHPGRKHDQPKQRPVHRHAE